MEQLTMRKLATIGVAAALAFGAQAASAADFSYNLAEVSYISGDHYDGFGLAGSLELAPQIFGHAGIDAIEFDGGLDGSLLGLGIGYAISINEMLDVIGTGSLKRFKFDGSNGEFGFGLGVGVRALLVEQLELQGGLEYVDVDTYSDTTFRVGGRWNFTPAFAAGLDYQDNDMGSAWRLVARFDFGSRM
jgi:opacity protein-like surface antigen